MASGPIALPIAATTSIGSELIVPLGAAAAALALFGMLLLLPLYITQRREIERLLEWRERAPEAGDGEAEREAAAAPATRAPLTGAAARVTSERPALARIGTAEQEALDAAPLWKRAVERGPRHPLVLSLLALAAAAVVFVAVALLLRATDNPQPPGSGLDRAAVDVVVLNASSSSGLADEVADGVEASDFTVAGTGVAQSSEQSVVRFAEDSERAGRVVAKRLGIGVVQPFDREAEAEAPDADVVVIAGEDRTRPLGGED